MRVRTLIAGFGLIVGSGNINAQLPQIPPLPGNPGSFPGSSLPAIPPVPLSPMQPIVPMNTQGPAQFPLQPASGYPGTYPANSPVFPPNPGAFPPSSYPSTMQPLIPGGPTYGSPQAQLNPIAQPLQISLPSPENKFQINTGDVNLKRMNNAWQLWVGQRLLRDFGDRETDARDALRVYRDLRPTEWAIIGAGKPVVEYGLVNGRTPLTAAMPGANEQRGPFSVVSTGDNQPVVTGAGAKQITPIDMRTARIEAIRGVWCLRDDFNIHLNFGVNRADADQALAVVRKYGFNRIGIVGNPTPAMTYFFAAPDTGAAMPKNAFTQITLQAQIESLTKVGIPVGGVGYIGEMVRFNSRAVEVRKEGSEWVVVGGNEVLGRYGQTEWPAREAVRTIQEAHFTEFCKVGSAGLTFFLVDGRAPTRVPFSVQGRLFDLNSLKVSKNGDRCAITENGRYLFDCANVEEGETLIRLLQYYQFDQLCHLGPTPKLGVSFLAKSR